MTDTEAENLLRDTMRARADEIEADDLLGMLSQARGRARRRAATAVALAMLATAAVTVGIVAFTANGGAGPAPTRPSPTRPAPGAGPGPYRVTGLVLESPEHGPRMCFMVLTSMPPQCGGAIDLVGWDWAQVEGAEAARETTWGDYEVTGTWDGARLTLTQPPGLPPASQRPEPTFPTACPEPPGGWAVVDPTKAGEDAIDSALNRALEAADARPDFGGAWLDRQPAITIQQQRARSDIDVEL